MPTIFTGLISHRVPCGSKPHEAGATQILIFFAIPWRMRSTLRFRRRFRPTTSGFTPCRQCVRGTDYAGLEGEGFMSRRAVILIVDDDHNDQFLIKAALK